MAVRSLSERRARMKVGKAGMVASSVSKKMPRRGGGSIQWKWRRNFAEQRIAWCQDLQVNAAPKRSEGRGGGGRSHAEGHH